MCAVYLVSDLISCGYSNTRFICVYSSLHQCEACKPYPMKAVTGLWSHNIDWVSNLTIFWPPLKVVRLEIPITNMRFFFGALQWPSRHLIIWSLTAGYGGRNSRTVCEQRARAYTSRGRRRGSATRTYYTRVCKGACGALSALFR